MGNAATDIRAHPDQLKGRQLGPLHVLLVLNLDAWKIDDPECYFCGCSRHSAAIELLCPVRAEFAACRVPERALSWRGPAVHAP